MQLSKGFRTAGNANLYRRPRFIPQVLRYTLRWASCVATVEIGTTNRLSQFHFDISVATQVATPT